MTEARLFAQSQIQHLLRNTNLKKKIPLYSRQQKLLVLQGVFALEMVPIVTRRGVSV